MENYVYYDIIKKGYNNSWQIPYEILLNTFEWRNFRETIINRDNKVCTICQDSPTEIVGNRHIRKPTAEEREENSKPLIVDVVGDGSEIGI